MPSVFFVQWGCRRHSADGRGCRLTGDGAVFVHRVSTAGIFCPLRVEKTVFVWYKYDSLVCRFVFCRETVCGGRTGACCSGCLSVQGLHYTRSEAKTALTGIIFKIK